MALGNLAGLYGILEGISAGTDIQRQQQELQQRQQLFNQQQAASRLQGQALQGLMQRGGQGGMPQMQQPIPPMPMPQAPQTPSLSAGPGGGLAQGPPRNSWFPSPSQAPAQPPLQGSMADLPRIMPSEQVAAGVGPWAQPAPGSGLSVPQLGISERAGMPAPAQARLVSVKNDTTQAGMAALQAGWPQPAARDVVQTGQAALNQLDPAGGQFYSLPQVAQAVEKAAGPDTDPAVKAMAIGGLMKLLQPEDQMVYRAVMAQNQMALKAGLTEYVQKEIDRRTQSGQSFREQQTQFVQSEEDRRAQERIQTGGARGGGAGAEPSSSAVDFWVKVLQQGGSLPPNIGRGRAGQALVTAVMDKIGQTGTDPGEFISAQATRKADTSSLQRATAMSDAAIGFEETALKNLEIATKQIHEVAPTELGPAINKWIEQGEQALGDPSVPTSVTSVITFANEYAKVMSGATGGQGATVDARREAAQLFNPYFSTGQWDRVKAIATADMNNRKAALTENIDRIKSRLSSKPQQQPSAPAATQQQADTQPVPDQMKNEADGTTIRNKSDGSLWIKKGDRLIRAPAGAEPTPAGQP